MSGIEVARYYDRGEAALGLAAPVLKCQPAKDGPRIDGADFRTACMEAFCLYLELGEVSMAGQVMKHCASFYPDVSKKNGTELGIMQVLFADRSGDKTLALALEKSLGRLRLPPLPSPHLLVGRVRVAKILEQEGKPPSEVLGAMAYWDRSKIGEWAGRPGYPCTKKETIEFLIQMAGKYPDFTGGEQALKELEEARGSLEEVVRSSKRYRIEDMVDSDPTPGLQAFIQGKFHEAIALLEPVMSMNCRWYEEQRVRGAHTLGLAYLYTGNYGEAEKFLTFQRNSGFVGVFGSHLARFLKDEASLEGIESREAFNLQRIIALGNHIKGSLAEGDGGQALAASRALVKESGSEFFILAALSMSYSERWGTRELAPLLQRLTRTNLLSKEEAEFVRTNISEYDPALKRNAVIGSLYNLVAANKITGMVLGYNRSSG